MTTKPTKRTPEAWQALCCSVCHRTLDWNGTHWTCPQCHAIWKGHNALTIGIKAIGYDKEHQ